MKNNSDQTDEQRVARESSTITSAFHFPNDKRIIIITDDTGIKSFECDENWNLHQKPFAISPHWYGSDSAESYHLKVRSMHDKDCFVPEYSTGLKEPTKTKFFRKKPIVIEAIQWNGNNAAEIIDFVGKKLEVSRPPIYYIHDHDITDPLVTIAIPTLEGRMTANRFDWIIKGINGEFYPCKPDIFEKTYESFDGLSQIQSHQHLKK